MQFNLKNKEALVRIEYSDLEQQQKAVVNENRKLMERIKELEEMLGELRRQKFHLEEELPKAKEDAEKQMKELQKKIEEITLQKSKAEQEAKRYRMELDDIFKEKEAAEQELERVKQLTLKAEAQRSIVEENLRAFRIQLEESDRVRKTFEDHLRKKDTNLQDLEQQKKALMEELKKKTTEETKLMMLIKEMERDLEFQGSLGKSKFREKEIKEVRREITLIGRETLLAGSDIFREKQEIKTIDEYQQLVHELTFANKKSEKIIKDLKYELNELELQNASSEEKSRLLKEKLDEANNSLRCLKIELDQKELVEQGYMEQLKELDRQLQKTTGKAEEVMQEAMDLKKLNIKYKEELKSLQKERVQLKRELEELARIHTQTEITIQQLNAQISSLQQEKVVAEQRTISLRGEASNLQEQIRKMQEQLLQKTREEKESQFNIQRLKDDLADSKHMVEKLKQKVAELSRSNSETKIMMTEVRTESEKIILERQIIDRKNDELKALAESFKEQLRVTNEELHKQIIVEQEHLDKIKSLEDELIKTKDLATEFKQKCDRENAYNMNAEMELRNLSSQLNTFSMEMNMSEQKIQQQQAYILELNNKMKKLQDDFHQKTLDEQMARKKVALLQEESIKFKHSAEEFRKKFEKLLESHNIAENDISGIRMECITLQQERHMAQENIRMYKIQIEDLQDKLQKCREQLQQGKHAEMEYLHKYRKLEEELHIQKRAVENLKHQMDLQKREHCNQLRMFQNEINKKNIQLDFGWKGNGFSYLGDTSPREFEQLNLCTTTSPLLRRRQIEISSPGCKTEQLVGQKLQMVATDSLPREKPYQMSGMAHSIENGITQQSYAEYVSQTSTQLEITIDKNNPLTRISEMDKLRDSKFLSSRHEDGYEMGLGKHLHPLEKVNNKQYGVHVEVTSLNQENGKNLGNEGRLLQGYRSSEGFRSEDISKMGSILEEKQAKEVDIIPSEYDNIKFQGLRHDVTAKQLIEVKLLDMSTAEQLHTGKKSVTEVQKNLEMFLTKPTAIAGLYIETSKDKMSFAFAAKQRVLEKSSLLALLEAQAATGFIIDPTTGQNYSVDDSVIKGLVDHEYKNRLLEAEKAVLGYPFSGRKLSVYQAIESRILERHKGKNILEVQIASGGIIDPVRSVRIPPEVAVQLGLLNNTILKFLHESSSNTKTFQNPNNKQAMYYSDLLKLCLLDLDSKCFLLPVGERKITTPSAEKIHKISVIDIKIGSEMTSYEAYKKGLIDKSTYLDLSGQEFQWKESTCFDSDGNSYLVLTDLKTGMQFNIDEALADGKVDRTLVSKYKEGNITVNEFGDILLSNSKPRRDLNSPIAGIWLSETNERIPVFKASRRNLVDRTTTLRFLEAQASTGGITDPFTGKRYSVAEALQRELIDEASAKHIKQCELAFTGIIHPISKSIMSVTEAININVLDKEMGTRCLEYQHLTGGLIDPKSHSRLTMEEAIKNGVIDAVTATKMKDDKFYLKSITCPKTKRKMTYKETLEQAVFDCHTGLRLLEAAELISSGISSLYFSTQ
ncbi:plectin-like [Sceloporus undulatus]|uniref:plectin-like n=1 Tax=Sceloporus undulatus TaxID=8520 RepID=UPI001C4B2163|nr:plectin-like [Sceloporus undulatus]